MFYFRKFNQNEEILINIKVATKASKNEIKNVKNDELLVSVTAVPENNKANIAIIELVSKKFKIAKSCVKIISGEKSKNKKISIDLENMDEKRKKNLEEILKKFSGKN